MKYPNAKIKEGTNVWYILLQEGDYPRQKPMYLTLDGKDEEYKNSNFNINFDTKELAEQALNAFNNMNNKRDYAALKQEGLKFAPDGFVYIGRGDPKNKLDEDWKNTDIHMLCKNEIPNRKLDIVMDDIGNDWTGNSTDAHYFVREEIWNKKFPNKKKPITLIEIKSQLTEAKKLIGKTVTQKDPAGKIHRGEVISVELYVNDYREGGEMHNKFFKENGYLISLKLIKCLNHGAFVYPYVEIVEDVKVNSKFLLYSNPL